jgi:adenylate cyclase
MRDGEIEAAILMADVAGSTSLYRAVGNAVALERISTLLDHLRRAIDATGGEFIHSKGDDVLCLYREPSAACAAVRTMLAMAGDDIAIHAGLTFGPVIRARDDVFGDPVNIAARLAARANPGEALVADSAAVRLHPAERAALRLLGQMNLKGAAEPLLIYRLSGAEWAGETRVVTSRLVSPLPRRPSAEPVMVELRHRGVVLICKEGESLTIGRSPECDLVIERQWISRNHAVISNQDGKPRLHERSSSGTFLAMGGEREIFIRREEVILVGDGRISPGMSAEEEGAEVIAFELIHRPPQ